jgi:hypothetical protein
VLELIVNRIYYKELILGFDGIENRESVIVKQYRLTRPVRMLKSSANLACLKSIFREASQRRVEDDRIGKLCDICQERLREELECIRHGPLANAMLVADLDVCGRADESVALCTVQARRVLEAVCCRPGEVRRPDLAVCEFDEAPGIVGVSKRGKVVVDSSLADSCHLIDLLFRICKAGLHIQKISSSVDLGES